MQSIFISHVFEDKKYLDKIKKWENKKELEGYKCTFETEDKRHEGKEAIRKHLKDKIRGASIILVLIGDNTHNHNWIETEVELANSIHKKICCIRIPETHGRKPDILSNYTELMFNPNQIMKELKK